MQEKLIYLTKMVGVVIIPPQKKPSQNKLGGQKEHQSKCTLVIYQLTCDMSRNKGNFFPLF